MKIRFNIEYRTNWGEDIRVQLNKITKDGQRKPVKECPLETYDGNLWEDEITLQNTGIVGVEYCYAMYRDDELVWTEWQIAPHKIHFDGVTTSYIVTDAWRPIPEDLPLYSSAFTECVGSHESDVLETLYASTLQLRVVEPRLRKGEYLAIIGSSPQFGEWTQPKRLSHIALQEWATNFDAAILYNEVEYKYVIVDKKNNILCWILFFLSTITYLYSTSL